MATIIREANVNADPAFVWDALRDFGALHTRLARGFVIGTLLESDRTRVVSFAGGAVAREELVGVDESARRLAYRIVESRLNAAHHHASAQVFDLGGGRSMFVWVADVLPDELAPVVGGLMDRGIDALKATLEGDWSMNERPG